MVCFEKSLDMLLADLMKEVTNREEGVKPEEAETKKEEDGDVCMAGPSKP